MKITLIRAEKESGKEALSTLEADALIKKLKTETKAGHVSTLRAILPQLEGTCAQYEHIDKLPRIYPAVEYSRTQEGERWMKNYNGLVQLEVNRLSGIAEAEYVKQQAALLPQTFAAFCGSSGRSAKIWVLFALPDGTTPKRESDATLFHAHAYRMAVKCYQPLLPFAITLKEPSLTQSCRMTLDGYPYYNPAAVPFCLEQPLGMPEEENFRQRKLAEKNPLLRLHPDSKASDTFAILFESALDRAFRELDGWKREGDLRILLVPLAEHCFKAGIPEEEVVRQTLMHYYREADEFIVRQTIHNLYQELKGFGKKSSLTQEQESVFRLEEFMGRRYEFRYNTVLDDLEYRQRDSVHFYFKPADQRARSTVSMNALKEGIRVWDRDINRFLTSDHVPLYNPVEEYLYDTGRWDGKDRIRALADLVPCHNPHWRELFYRWFLGMVAHWRGMDRQHGNNTSPLLVGSQGFRKSTFCRILLPPELRFGYTDSIDFKSKQEAERYLGRFFLINIDEFDQVSARHQGFLKHLLQKPVVNVRKPHATQVESVKRYASFIATSNHTDLLGDPSGSRRFICIEVKGMIDNAQPIDYLQLYAQAVAALKNNERYWLTHEEEVSQMQANEAFQQRPLFEDLFFQYYRPASHKEEGLKISAGEIYLSLQKKSGVKLPMSNVSVFGRFLKKIGLKTQLASRGRLYLVVEK